MRRSAPWLLIPWLAVGARGADLPLFDVTFGRPLPPLVACVEPASIADGVLHTATVAGWRRSGLRVGPLPVPQGTLSLTYAYRALALGPQSQELTSEVPSTHWYMLFADAAGRYHLHTRVGNQWAQRLAADQPITVGTWYRAEITLTATSIAGRIVERDGGKMVFEFPATPVDSLGAETTFFLCDEGLETGTGRTEWASLTIATDDPGLKTQIDAKVAQVRREQQERAAMVAASRRLRAMGVALLPWPRDVQVGTGEFRLTANTRIGAPAALRGSAAEVRAVLRERCARDIPLGERGILLAATRKSGAPPDPSGQGYRLVVTPTAVTLTADAAVGFYYGAQTLAQLIRGDGTIPAVSINDRPAIPERLVMVAIDQGGFQVIDMDYWKRIIRELAAVKINRVMPYFEGAGFAFRKYPFLALRGEDGFTIAKARELSEYGQAHHLQLLPQQQSLGHAGVYFAHPELASLREEGGTFCSSKPETFAFLGDLYDDLCEAFPYAEAIHVGGDEFGGDFAKCTLCEAKADAIGKPGLYAEHMRKLHDLLAARQRRMMIWWHEEGFTDQAADKLPHDIAVFDWHYGNQSSYPTLAKLQQEGFVNAWATPAVTRYYDPGDDFDNTFGNLSGFLRAGAAAKVPGECTCTWVHGIWGGRNLFELNLYALLYSAQCAWNPAGDDRADYQWRYARQWFGLSGGDLSNAVQQAIHAPYGEAKEQGFWRDNQALEPLLAAAPKDTLAELGKHPEWVAQAGALLGFCRRADSVLERWSTTAQRNQVTLEYLRNDVRIHAAAARKILLVASLDKALAAPPAERPALLAAARRELGALLPEFGTIETMFRRSVREAGGGEAGWGGWYPFVAKGGVLFRVADGRRGLQELDAALAKLGEGGPESPW